MSGFRSKINQDLKYLINNFKEQEFVEYIKCSINTTTIQLTLITALKAVMPNVSI